MDWNREIREFKTYLRLEKGLADNSIQAYLRDVDHLASFMTERGIEPEKVKLDDLQQLLKQLNDLGIAPTSQRRMIAGWRMFFKQYINEDGLLENLDAWVFVEWSRANYLTAGVNFPSNMLYAACLEAMSEMYDDPALGAQAQAMRETIRRLSFNGQFFVDQMLRDESGKLYLQGDVTEVCQYYAFYCGTATKELYPELWNTLLYDFGPWRKENNKYPEVHFANAFIGNYLRLDMMAKND